MNRPSCRRPVWATCVLILAASLCAAAAAPAFSAERGPTRKAAARGDVAETEARVIVKFKADSGLMRALSASTTGTGAGGSGPQHAQALSRRLGMVLSDGHALGPRTQLLTAAGLSSRQLAEQLGAQSDVEYAVVDGRKRALAATPNDPLYGAQSGGGTTPASGQWYLQAPGATYVSAINAEAAWAISSGKGSIVVADLDTGVRFDHPDLASKLLPGYDFIANTSVSNDGDGRDSDPSDPGDWITSAESGTGTFRDCGMTDSSWHGTQTAGVIGAATNNGIGMAGIGRDVMVLPVRVLGKCGGFDSDIIAAMRWSAGFAVSGVPANPNPARVINLSLGETGSCSSAYQDTINELVAANVVVVVAAGNEGLAIGTPANCVGVIAVAGVRHAGTKVGYSDLGPTVTISAPAGNCVNGAGQTCDYPILTTSNSGLVGPVIGAAGAIYTGSGGDASVGTSFSAPLVAGTVALMLSSNRTLTPAQVTSALQSTARPFPSSGAAPIRLVAGGPLVPVSACTAPTSVPQDYECYCTTSTCGAGLLDAGAAVTAVAITTANISVASTSALVGSSVALDGSGSSTSVGKTINTYLWAISSATGLASITSSNTASTATLLTSAAGNVTVTLTVTDSAGLSDTTSTTLAVSAPPPPAGSSGGGGGALQLGWLLGWLAAVLLVRAVTPRPRRA